MVAPVIVRVLTSQAWLVMEIWLLFDKSHMSLLLPTLFDQ